jgi:hypothetical protein
MTRIYVASLSDYNAGHLLGRWIELDSNTERSDIATEISEVPEKLRSYFDAEEYLRDMKLGGDVSFECIDGTHYAFWN